MNTLRRSRGPGNQGTFLGPVFAPASDGRRPEWINALALLVMLVAPLFAGAWLQSLGLPLFWPFFAVAVGIAPLLFWRLRHRPAVVVAALMVWFATHKLLIALLSTSFGATEIAWLQNYKEAMYLALFVVGLAAAVAAIRPLSAGKVLSRLQVPDRLAVAFLGLVAIYFVLSVAIQPQDLRGELVYARRFASLPIIFVAGRLLMADRADLQRTIRYLVGLALLVAIFGILERLVLGDGFWTNVAHIRLFHTSVVDEGFGSSRARLVDGIPANWISYLGDSTIRRLVSSFLEPTTLALFLALSLGLTLFAMPDWARRRRSSWIATGSIISLALALTIGKGGYLVMVVIALVVLARTSRASVARVIVAIGAIVAVALLIGQLLPVATNLDRHLQGLVTGLGHVLGHPVGSGLGTTGFWGTQGKIGTDSTAGAVASQLGVAGIVLYLAWLASAAWRLLPVLATGEPWSTVRRTMSGAVLALLAVGIVSNSASGLLGGFFYMVLAGWMITIEGHPGPARDIRI